MKWLTLILVVIFIGLQIRLWTGERSLAEVNALELKISEQKAANELQTDQNEQLRARVGDLKDGTDAIEEEARSGQGFVKEDEVFVIVTTE